MVEINLPDGESAEVSFSELSQLPAKQPVTGFLCHQQTIVLLYSETLAFVNWRKKEVIKLETLVRSVCTIVYCPIGVESASPCVLPHVCLIVLKLRVVHPL